jgi:hypothetical protein
VLILSTLPTIGLLLVFIQFVIGCECAIANFTPKTESLVRCKVLREFLPACKQLVADIAGRVALVNIYVIIAG